MLLPTVSCPSAHRGRSWGATVSARSERSEPRSREQRVAVSARSERSEPRSREQRVAVSARSERSEPRSREQAIAVSARSITVVVQSRRRLVRDALCAYLASCHEFDVVGEVAGIAGLTALCARRRPAVVLVDAPALNVEVIDSLRGVREANPTTEIVVTYTEASPPTVTAAARAGITALVPSSQGLDAVVR